MSSFLHADIIIFQSYLSIVPRTLFQMQRAQLRKNREYLKKSTEIRFLDLCLLYVSQQKVSKLSDSFGAKRGSLRTLPVASRAEASIPQLQQASPTLQQIHPDDLLDAHSRLTHASVPRCLVTCHELLTYQSSW